MTIPTDDEMLILKPRFNSYGKIDLSKYDSIEPHKRKEFYKGMIIMPMLHNISEALYVQLMYLYARGELEKAEYWIKCILETHIKKV